MSIKSTIFVPLGLRERNEVIKRNISPMLASVLSSEHTSRAAKGST